MSAETVEAVQRAIQAHVDGEQPGIVTDWAVIACVKNLDNIDASEAFYQCIMPATQPYHATVGLAHTLSMLQDEDD